MTQRIKFLYLALFPIPVWWDGSWHRLPAYWGVCFSYCQSPLFQFHCDLSVSCQRCDQGIAKSYTPTSSLDLDLLSRNHCFLQPVGPRTLASCHLLIRCYPHFIACFELNFLLCGCPSSACFIKTSKTRYPSKTNSPILHKIIIFCWLEASHRIHQTPREGIT